MGECWEIQQGEVLDRLRGLPDNHFDACLTDPPYGLGKREPTAQEIAEYILGTASLDMGGDFMSNEWELPPVAVWREMYRVLKPGAHLLVYSGTRTFDLVTVGMRAAGFRIRDTMMWVYGSGMPHGIHNIGKAIDKADKVDRPVIGSRVLTGNAALSTKDKGGTYGVQVGSAPSKRVDVTGPGSDESAKWEGHGTGLKPAWEPVVVAMKPLEGTVVKNLRAWGTGGLNIEGARVDVPGEESDDLARWPSNVVLSHSIDCVYIGTKRVKASNPTGQPCVDSVRAPGVLQHDDPSSFKGNGSRVHYAGADGLEEVEQWECAGDCPIRILDQQSGVLTSGSSNGFVGEMSASVAMSPKRAVINASAVYADSGGASRYFYTAKVDRAEREFGCEHLPVHIDPRTVHLLTHHCTSCSLTNARHDANSAGIVACPGTEDGVHTLVPEPAVDGTRNFHPTLKPVALNEHFATMLLVPKRETSPRTLLIPYSGAGSEMIGAMRAGWDSIVGIEREASFIATMESQPARDLEPHPE